MSAPEPLYVALFRGGSISPPSSDHLRGLDSDDAIWLDLDGEPWGALVADEETAQKIAADTGADLVSCEAWDGEAFGDHASGTVRSPHRGVLDVSNASGFIGRLSAGWEVQS